MMAELIANIKAKTIIGGGSTAEVIYELGLADKMTFVSTGGGASLKFLSGESLPGIEALRDKK
jgi:phosphoglycerate kinase